MLVLTLIVWGTMAKHRCMSFRIINAQFCSSLLVQIWTNGIALVEQRFKQLRRIRTGAPFCPAFIAAGVDPCGAFEQSIAKHCGAEQVEMARREIAKVRLDFVRWRALEVCIGLQPLQLDALQLCEILQHSCGPVACVIAFHQWWTTVKHDQPNDQY
jgi:hypothetical protein